MKLEEINSELTDITEFCACYYNKDNGVELSERLTSLNVYLARSAVLLGEAQEVYGNSLAEKSNELLSLDLAPSVFNNVLKGRLAVEQKLLTLCERMNRTITHQIDGIRSQLSYLKSFND